MQDFLPALTVNGLAAPSSRSDIGSGTAGSDKHDARAEELTGLREFSGDAPGMEHDVARFGRPTQARQRRSITFIQYICQEISGF